VPPTGNAPRTLGGFTTNPNTPLNLSSDPKNFKLCKGEKSDEAKFDDVVSDAKS